MNKKKIFIFLVIILSLFLIIGYFYKDQKIAILGYHSFYKDKSELKGESEFINDINSFEKQMKYLHDHNYKTLTLDEFYKWKKGKLKLPRKSVLITIDDGNLSNYMYAFDILKKYDMNAVVFYVGAYAKEYGVEEGTIYDVMSLDLINKCKEEYPNIEFQSHSYDLHASGVTNKSKEELDNDTKEMNKQGNFEYFAYPFGVYSEDMKEVLINNNYKLAFGFGYDKEGKNGYKKTTKKDDDYLISRLNISNNVSFSKFLLRLYLPY